MRAALLLLLAVRLAAGSFQPRIDPEAVQFDALVVDGAGEPVRDLGPDDFEILQDGQAREILQAEWVEARRALAVIVDDLGLTPRGMERARAALESFLEKRMRPGDQMALLRTSEGTGATAFTTDRAALADAVSRLAVHPLAAREKLRGERFNVATLGLLHYVLRGLREIDGRKTLVLLSDRLDSFEPESGDETSDSYLRMLGDRALRSGAALEAGPAALELPPDYYQLAYRPDRGIFDRAFHRLEVRVKRPGLRVRSRNGFYGNEIPPRRMPLFSATARGELYDALFLPFTTAEVPVRITALPMANEKNEPFLRVLFAVEPGALAFTEADGQRQAAFEVLLVSLGLNGKTLQQSGQLVTVRSPGRVMFHVDQPLGVAGPVHVRAAVRDRASGRRGSAYYFAEMPPVGEGKLSLSGIYMGRAGMALGNPALRIFRAGEEAPYAFTIYHAKRPPRLETSVRVTGRQGTLIDTPYSAVAAEEDGGARSWTRSAVLELGPETPPGEYTLEVFVRDLSAKAGENEAAESVRFTVTPPARLSR